MENTSRVRCFQKDQEDEGNSPKDSPTFQHTAGPQLKQCSTKTSQVVHWVASYEHLSIASNKHELAFLKRNKQHFWIQEISLWTGKSNSGSQLHWCKMSLSPSPPAAAPCLTALVAEHLSENFPDYFMRNLSGWFQQSWWAQVNFPEPYASVSELFTSPSSRDGCNTSDFQKRWVLESVTYLNSPARRASRDTESVKLSLCSTLHLGNKQNVHNISTIGYPGISSAPWTR